MKRTTFDGGRVNAQSDMNKNGFSAWKGGKLLAQGYYTPSCGWCSDVIAPEGAIVVLLSRGNQYEFSQYGVYNCSLERAIVDIERRRRLNAAKHETMIRCWEMYKTLTKRQKKQIECCASHMTLSKMRHLERKMLKMMCSRISIR